MAAVPHVTSGSGLRKFQADGFLFDRVYTHKNAVEPTVTYLCCNMWDSHRGIDDESSLLGHGTM